MSDLGKLAVDLSAAAGKARRLADIAVRKTGLDVVNLAKQKAPVDTGTLRGSIGMDVLGPAHVQVGPGVHYAPFLEYGTSRMSARPFMGPAADAVTPGLTQALDQIGASLITGG